jgi:tRNA A-37 threonylcarbamoyl transferase component Bud32
MTPRGSGAQERWLRLSALYDEAAAQPRDAWVAFLEARCPDDAPMRDELLRMLEAAVTAGPLDAPPHPLPAASAPIVERLDAALKGRYRLIAEIAQGGMGAVYRAHELKHRRDVILKVLRPDTDLGASRARFESEVQIAAKLAHPHIVPLLDSGDAGGLLYFVMPSLPGETLRARISRMGAIPVPDAMKLMRDIADALYYAHGAGVVHRDLKPENILCSGEHAFLLDFGIAQYTQDRKDAPRLTYEGNAVGTPRYMAPEQAAGRVVDHRADLFAWGIVANEMLHGDRRGDLDAAGLRSDVPEALSALIYRCLSPDPARRPASAGTLVAALDALMSGAPLPREESAAAAAKAMHEDRRRRRLWRRGLALAAVVAVVALAWQSRRPSPVTVGDLLLPVAVLPFREDGMGAGDAGVRGRLAAAWITQGLHQTGIGQVVPWTDVLRAVEAEEDAEAALRRRLPVGTIVTGTIFQTPEAMTLHAEIRGARGTRLLASLEPVRVAPDSLEQGILLIRDRLLGALAVTRDERFVGLSAVRERPPTFEAYRAFDAALVDFHAQRYRPAIAGFRESFARDSAFIAPVVYAAQAAWNTSQYALVDSLLDLLDSRRDELAVYYDHLRVQLRAMLDGDARAAYAAAAAAAALAPDSRAAYDAALMALWLGWADSARVRLEALSPDRGAMIGWPSYWTNLAHARHLTGAHDLERRAAREMRARHPTTRVAWVLEARALAALRDSVALEQLLAEAERLEPDVYWSYGGMLVTAGEEYAAHGDTLTGLQYAARALAWLRTRLTLQPENDDHLYWMATAQHLRGDFAGERATMERLVRLDGRSSYRETLALAAELSGRPGALAELPLPPPYDLGSRLAAEMRLASVRGDRATRDAKARELDRVGMRSRPWLHGTAWRELGPVPR